MIKNTAIHKELLRNGFAIIEANLSKEIEQLDSFIQNQISGPVSDFYYSFFAHDFEQNKWIRDTIKELLSSFYEKHFDKYRTINESFLIKPALTASEFLLHQDWCYTDERQYEAYNVWIPLTEVTNENGAMFFLPGSQLWFDNIRSGTLGTSRVSMQVFPPEKIISVPLKKGDVLLFHPAVFHGSYPNLSDKDRNVITSTIMNADAPFLHFQKISDVNEVRVLAPDDETFLRELNTLATGGEIDVPEIKRMNYEHKIISEAELLERCLGILHKDRKAE